MKSFGKIISLVLVICIAFSCNVYAAENADYADTLYELGLFKGTENGYELERSLSREESATMLVRLLGEEDNLDSNDYDEIFEDVSGDRWSFSYVMYCFENEITKGTGANTFSPELTIDAQQFVTLVLRLMGYTDIEPENALEQSIYLNMLNSGTVRNLEKATVFTRDDMVYIVYRSLMCKMSDGTLLADYLAEKGVISENEAAQFNVYESSDDINDLLDNLLGK